MEKTETIAALAALAQETRLDVYRLLVQAGLPLGRLPGDIRVSKGNFTLYSPLMTGLLISIVLTVVLNLLLRR